MAFKFAMRQLTIRKLMIIAPFAGVILALYIKNCNDVRIGIARHDLLMAYVHERLAFTNLMEQVAANPPMGVDGAQWMACVHRLADEPIIHPLRGVQRNDGTLPDISELALLRNSLLKISDYLEQVILKSPVDLEVLPAVRKRILQDYDPEARLTQRRAAEHHPANCEADFRENYEGMKICRDQIR